MQGMTSEMARRLWLLRGFGILALFLAHPCAGEHACVTHIPIHKLIQQPDNALKFANGRNISVEQYSIGGCGTDRRHPSGKHFVGNYSILSQNSNISTDACLIGESINKEAVYDSMQAIVLRTNGFTMAASSIDLEDIDSESNVPISNASRDSALVFGMQNGNVVYPDPMVYADSVLRLKQYFVPAPVMRQLGFKREYIRVVGVEHGTDFVHNCPFGHVENADPEAVARCKFTASFTAGVDTLVIMHALSQKSSKVEASRSVTLVSELRLRCSDGAHKQISKPHR